MSRSRLILHIFYVKQRESAGMFFEVCYRVGSSMCDPETVHFEFHQLRIKLVQQVIVSRSFAVLGEFEIMIVITELDPGLLCGFTCFVENVDQLLEIVERFPLLRLKNGVDHIFEAESLRILNMLVPSALNILQHVMPARGSDRVIAEYLHELGWGFSVQRIDFNVLIADLRNLFDGARNIFLELIAQ